MFGRILTFLILRVLARAFPGRYRLIPGVHGKPLLHQFKLTGWAYLQSFQNPEGPGLFHCHRWKRMFSVVLSGSFVEERYPGGMFLKHPAPSFYWMDHTVIHRLHEVEPNTWTLFFMFQNKIAWGYFLRPLPDDILYKPWDAVVLPKNRVPPL